MTGELPKGGYYFHNGSFAEMKHLSLLLTALLLASSLFAQSDCGTVVPPGYESTMAQRLAQAPVAAAGGGLIIVPVHIHLMRESDGNSTLTLQQIQTELDSVNFYYQNAGLIFIECLEAEMIDDDNSYNFESSIHQSDMLNNHFTQNVLNLYFANTVSLSSSPVCGYSWFPGGPDAAFISGVCATNGSTLAHEIGHYMGLMHTHGGSSGELVDGSNCSQQGDLICDTPADPGLSGLVDNACMYTGTALDANNQPYQPDVTNIMSYSRKVCRTSFTTMQYAVINATYWSDRSYLQCGPTSLAEPVFTEARVFPNPASDELRVLFANGADAGSVIEIMDANGRCVFTRAVAEGSAIETIDVSAFAQGMYTCRVSASAYVPEVSVFAITH